MALASLRSTKKEKEKERKGKKEKEKEKKRQIHFDACAPIIN